MPVFVDAADRNHALWEARAAGVEGRLMWVAGTAVMRCPVAASIIEPALVVRNSGRLLGMVGRQHPVPRAAPVLTEQQHVFVGPQGSAARVQKSRGPALLPNQFVAEVFPVAGNQVRGERLLRKQQQIGAGLGDP